MHVSHLSLSLTISLHQDNIVCLYWWKSYHLDKFRSKRPFFFFIRLFFQTDPINQQQNFNKLKPTPISLSVLHEAKIFFWFPFVNGVFNVNDIFSVYEKWHFVFLKILYFFPTNWFGCYLLWWFCLKKKDGECSDSYEKKRSLKKRTVTLPILEYQHRTS